MRRIIIRHDLMKKSEYAIKFNVSRPTIDLMIKNGELSVERISGTDYIKIK